MPHPPHEPPLSTASREWLAATDPLDRKRLGQYLTPRPVAEALLDRVRLRPGMRVLDPGAGTGELLAAVARREPAAELTGWDIDASALATAARLVPGATMIRRSALEPDESGHHGGAEPGTKGSWDLVIANPPYFQVPVTPELKARFGEVISGRANVFALFFKAGLDLLLPGGTLAFIVPPSMNSGAYFEALREHIIERARITDLTVLDGSARFEGANTAAQLLVLEKDGGSDGAFVFEHAEPDAGFRRIVFSQSPERLRRGFDGRRTLWQLGYEAVTGTVVWNQRRKELSPDPVPGAVSLVWSSDLRGGSLDLAPGPGGWGHRRRAPARAGRREGARSRPGYVVGPAPIRGPALLVNRVVGSVGRGEIRNALVPEGVEFVAENHVNVVRARPGVRPALGWNELQRSISSGEVAERVRMLTGNTQISARELTHLLPL